MEIGIWRKFWAEVLGTFLLVLIGCGSVAATAALSAAGAPALDIAGLVGIGLAFGMAVLAAIYAIGHISGCHINPAVTVALASTGRMSWGDAWKYILGQLIGATLAAYTLALVFGGIPGNLGATAVGGGFTAWQAYLAELVGTFVLVFTIFGAAVDGRAPKGWAGTAIGLVVAGIIIVMGVPSGSAINPARAFGPYLAVATLGGTVNWVDFILGYTLAALIGGVLAAFVYDAIAAPRAVAPDRRHAAAD